MHSRSTVHYGNEDGNEDGNGDGNEVGKIAITLTMISRRSSDGVAGRRQCDSQRQVFF